MFRSPMQSGASRIILGAGVVVSLACVWKLSREPLTFDLLHIDWTAIAAVATAFSAAFAAWAALAASNATRIALEIESRHEREKRAQADLRALVTSAALATELQKLCGIGKSITQVPSSPRPEEEAKALAVIQAVREMVSTPTLELFAERFFDFDLVTASHLSQAMAIAFEFRRKIKVPENITPTNVGNIVESFRDSGRVLRRSALLARRKLSQFVRRTLPKQLDRAG